MHCTAEGHSLALPSQTVLLCLQAQAATPGAATSTLSDVTARHQQQPLPAVPPHTGNQPSSQSDATGPQADAAQQSDIKEHVQEQCMSAKGWLRGLVEDRHMTSQTPAKHSPMPTSLPAVQVHASIVQFVMGAQWHIYVLMFTVVCINVPCLRQPVARHMPT